MSDFKHTYAEFSGFTRRNQELRQKIVSHNLARLATHTGANFNPGTNVLELAFWGQPISILFPEIQIIDGKTQKNLPEFSQTMILYYLSLADGAPLTGRWISFSELPDGKFYQRAFQGYTGQELTREIGNSSVGFAKAAEALNAQKGAIGNASYIFQALPRVPLLIAHWQGDEDFPASFQVLFDESVPHYLPTDGCAILGSTLTRKLIKTYQSLV